MVVLGVDYRIELVHRIVESITARESIVLDLGCRKGEVTAPFKYGKMVIGIDLLDEFLQEAKKSICVLKSDFDKSKLPFRDKSFDVVLCCEVIEHCLNTDHLLRETGRVLKTGGFLVLSFPNINQPLSWFAMISLDYPPIYSARYKSWHVRDFTFRLIRKALELSGFRICEAKGTYIRPFKNRISKHLAGRIPRLADQIVILSRKIETAKDSSEYLASTEDIFKL